jgi:biopolymer transport protein ExbD
MAFKKIKRPPAEIPTASMSDIAFLLLIFFLTTTKFDNKEGLGLVLPRQVESNAPEVHLKKTNLTQIWVSADGSTAIVIGDAASADPIDVSQIATRVKDQITSNPNMVVQITTDRNGRYSDMVKVLEQVRAAGAEKISLASK